jgi:hypothetical protein
MPSLLTQIEDVRAALMTVDAQLHCLVIAISEGSNSSTCSIVASHTHELVTELLERLDQLVSSDDFDDEVAINDSQKNTKRGARSSGD